MKKLLFLSLLLTIVSCTTDRLLYEELTLIDGRDMKTLLFYEGKAFTGFAFSVHPNGQLKSEVSIKNGILDGLYQEWYDNGQLKSEINLKDGQLYGVYQQWYENGQLLSEGNYKNGYLNGIEKYWYSGGQLLSEANYKDGERGLYQEWYENGQKLKIGMGQTKNMRLKYSYKKIGDPLMLIEH